jgi:hypothetical protein
MMIREVSNIPSVAMATKYNWEIAAKNTTIQSLRAPPESSCNPSFWRTTSATRWPMLELLVRVVAEMVEVSPVPPLGAARWAWPSGWKIHLGSQPLGPPLCGPCWFPMSRWRGYARPPLSGVVSEQVQACLILDESQIPLLDTCAEHQTSQHA